MLKGKRLSTLPEIITFWFQYPQILIIEIIDMDIGMGRNRKAENQRKAYKQLFHIPSKGLQGYFRQIEYLIIEAGEKVKNRTCRFIYIPNRKNPFI